MVTRVLAWSRGRRFATAYWILRNEGERHRAAGHDVTFNATNESYICLECLDCPWFPESGDEDDDDG
jgi:hypothetical protein